MKLKEFVSTLTVEIADALIMIDGEKAPGYIWKGFILTITGIALWSFFLGYSVGCETNNSLIDGHIAIGSMCGIYMLSGFAFMIAGLKSKDLLKG